MDKGSAKKEETALVPEVVEPVLSRRHEAVIVALLVNPKIADAAKFAGVNESTVWRLMQRPDFQQRFRAAQEQALNGALGTLQGAATEAIATLQRNMSCGIPTAENQAAMAILNAALKARERFDFDARLKEIEARLQDKADGA
ncbi:MAG: transposase family protein [Pyrinomonadaceae bacterium]